MQRGVLWNRAGLFSRDTAFEVGNVGTVEYIFIAVCDTSVNDPTHVSSPYSRIEFTDTGNDVGKAGIREVAL